MLRLWVYAHWGKRHAIVIEDISFRRAATLTHDFVDYASMAFETRCSHDSSKGSDGDMTLPEYYATGLKHVDFGYFMRAFVTAIYPPPFGPLARNNAVSAIID